MARSPKNFFLNSSFQGQQIMYSFLSFVLGCCSMGAAVFVAYYIYTLRFAPNDPMLQLKLVDYFLTIGFPVVLGTCAILGICLIVPFAIITSHRTAGPLVALRRYVRALCDGDYSAKLRLRDGDELQELAGELKSLATKLKSHEWSSEKDSLDDGSQGGPDSGSSGMRQFPRAG